MYVRAQYALCKYCSFILGLYCYFVDSTLDGLAVDYLNRLLFLTDAGLNQITAISLFQPKYSKVIISQNLDKPRAIVAHPWKG